ncbi:hypothetical protein CRV01_05215 [Arcobacter sp. CECT 8983]|uniref:DUF883 domain-containing protein n=1 Tax=Arcobacter sp. CECT 8983 TaxID=2044508 RepID=UPI00100AF963|nr:DUF883 domain-containing protein [Arcobacter sp. CECT 8983]NVJ53911.1 DUF883 domain-containing protein [Campylobacteraceae bacterium]RXJ90556.1 hypothetical protein CRV01_05215 [Arcobacter sp. CECT 8983]
MATQEVTKLKEEIEVLKADIKELSSTLKEVTSAKVNKSASKLDVFEDLSMDELKAKLYELKTKGLDEVGEIETKIKNDPFKSVAITFGLGFLAAWLAKK